MLFNELIKSLNPIIRNETEAIDFRNTSGTIADMDPPVKAPNKLAKTRAEEEPRKTANGLLDVPLIVKVANCVLSPNSAMNTVKNVDNNKFMIIYMYILIIS